MQVAERNAQGSCVRTRSLGEPGGGTPGALRGLGGVAIRWGSPPPPSRPPELPAQPLGPGMCLGSLTSCGPRPNGLPLTSDLSPPGADREALGGGGLMGWAVKGVRGGGCLSKLVWLGRGSPSASPAPTRLAATSQL